MLAKLAKLFDGLSEPGDKAVDENQLTRLAATALMIEMCRADNSVDEVEIKQVLEFAKQSFGISDAEADELLAEATQSNEQAISLYEFTDVINRNFEKPAKYQLVKQIWQVAYADGFIDRHEDHLIRKIAELIYVSHSDFIRAKHEVIESSNQ